MEWNCLSIPTLYVEYDYLSMLMLKIIHASKDGPCWYTCAIRALLHCCDYVPIDFITTLKLLHWAWQGNQTALML